MGATLFNSGFKSDLTKLFPSTVLVTQQVNNGFTSDLKISSLHNTNHNKCKELLPTKLQFNLDKNPTWSRISDAV
jgi:hypothetical protein